MGELLAVLKRRWPFAMLAVVLAIAAAAGGFLLLGPTYRYTAAVLLLPPKISTTSDDFTGGNPLFYLGSLTQARDIVVSELNSKNVQDQVEDRFPDTTYSAAKDVLGSSPVVVITVEGSDDGRARQLSQYLTGLVPQTLVTLQDRLGIRQSARIASEPLSIDQKPELRNRTQLRAAIVAGGGVFAAGVAVIALIDGLLATRRGKAERTPPPRPAKSARRRGGAQEGSDQTPVWDDAPAESSETDAALVEEPSSDVDRGAEAERDGVSAEANPSLSSRD